MLQNIYTAIWLSSENYRKYGAVDEDMINKFRHGRFQDQTDGVQQAFLFCMLQLMPNISKAWTNRTNVHQNFLISEKITRSDEALLYWYLICYGQDWIEEFKQENGNHDNNTSVPRQRRYKPRGKHVAKEFLYKYVDKMKELISLWDDPTTGKGWDIAIQAEVNRECESEQQTEVTVGPVTVTAETHKFPHVNFADFELGDFAAV